MPATRRSALPSPSAFASPAPRLRDRNISLSPAAFMFDSPDVMSPAMSPSFGNSGGANDESPTRLIGQLTLKERAAISSLCVQQQSNEPLRTVFEINAFLSRLGLPQRGERDLTLLLASLEPPFIVGGSGATVDDGQTSLSAAADRSNAERPSASTGASVTRTGRRGSVRLSSATLRATSPTPAPRRTPSLGAARASFQEQLSYDQLVQLVAVMKQQHRAERLADDAQKRESAFDNDVLGLLDLRDLFVSFGGHRDESGVVVTEEIVDALTHVLVYRMPESDDDADADSRKDDDGRSDASRSVSLQVTATTPKQRPSAAPSLESSMSRQSLAAALAAEIAATRAAAEKAASRDRLRGALQKVEDNVRDALQIARVKTKNKKELDFPTFVTFVDTFREMINTSAAARTSAFAGIDLTTPIEEDIVSAPDRHAAARRMRFSTTAKSGSASSSPAGSPEKRQRSSSTTFKDVARMLTASLKARAQIKELHTVIVDRAMIKRIIDRHNAKLKRAMTPHVTTALSFNGIRNIDILLPSGELLPAGKRPEVKKPKMYGRAPDCVRRDKLKEEAMLGELCASVEADVEARLQHIGGDSRGRSRSRSAAASTASAAANDDPHCGPPLAHIENDLVRQVARNAALAALDKDDPQLSPVTRGRRAKLYEARVLAARPKSHTSESTGGDRGKVPFVTTVGRTDERREHGSELLCVVLLCERAPPLRVELAAEHCTSLPKLIVVLEHPLQKHVEHHEEETFRRSGVVVRHHPPPVFVSDIFIEMPPNSGRFFPLADPQTELFDGCRLRVALR